MNHRSGRKSRMTVYGVLLAAIASVTITCSVEQNTSPDTERSRYLLMDGRIVEETENAKLVIGTITKDERNPLFGEDKPWEKRYDNLYANVVYDSEEKLYKCWYSPFIIDDSSLGMTLEQRKNKYRPPRDREMAICYAESKDGIIWDKPNLDLIEFDGSRMNNIVWRGPHGSGVFRVPDTAAPVGKAAADLGQF